MKMNCLSQKMAALLLGGSLLAGTCAVVLTVHAGEQAAKPKSIGLIVDDRPLAHDVKSSTSFAPVVKKVVPSVVKVEVKIPGHEAQLGLPDDPFFRQFFGNQFGGQRRVITPPEHGVGSGVIVTKDGYILTNNHVVDGADEVKVTLNDGTRIDRQGGRQGPEVGPGGDQDRRRHDLPAITFADSGQCEVGDVVLAVGNPFGIGQTVTMGIISATGRGHDGTWITRTSSKPTRRSIPAIPAARWWMRRAAWSASTPPFSAATAATRALASPSRRTWPAASWSA